MAKKEFKLKYCIGSSADWYEIRNSLNYHIGFNTKTEDYWSLKPPDYFLLERYETYIIKNYIPEKHDSIINELILKYG